MNGKMITSWDDVERLYQNGSFCPEAWNSISSTTDGKWRMCCYSGTFGGTNKDTSLIEHLNHQDRKDIRLDMLNGRVNNACQRCQHMQDQGTKSRRDRIMAGWREDETAMSEILRSLRTTQDDGTIDSTYLERIDIKFTGNQCNLKCFTCNPGNSSALGVQAKAMGEKPADYKPVHSPFDEMTAEMSEEFWSDLAELFPKTRILNFTGGEPFMLDEYWRMIELAISTGAASNMELHLSSNMTVMKWNKKSVLDYFGAFRRVRLQASIDGFGKWNDYIRYPSDYLTVVQNMMTVREKHQNVSLVASSVVGALSVKSIPELHRAMQERGIRHTYHNVQFVPTYQRLEWLPMDVKKRYLDIVYSGHENEFGDIIDLLQKPEDLDHHQALINRCNALDRFRGTNAQELWPEFYW